MSGYLHGECRHPDCNSLKLIHARGLCAYHWRELSYLVYRGEATWPELEAKGWALPPYTTRAGYGI